MSKRKDKKQKNRDKRITTFTLIAFTTLLLCLALFYIGCDAYRSDNLDGTELSYLGSIVGGGLTLIGVIMTIMITIDLQKDDLAKREEERKDNLSIEYKPIIQIESKKIEAKLYSVPDYQYELDEDGIPYVADQQYHTECYIYVTIRLKNIGRGEITNSKVSCNYKDDYFNVDLNKQFETIYQGDYFDLNFSFELENYEKIVEEMYSSNMIINIVYSDCVMREAKVQIPYYIENFPPTYDYDEYKDTVTKTSDNHIECSIGAIIRNVKI